MQVFESLCHYQLPKSNSLFKIQGYRLYVKVYGNILYIFTLTLFD